MKWEIYETTVQMVGISRLVLQTTFQLTPAEVQTPLKKTLEGTCVYRQRPGAYIPCRSHDASVAFGRYGRDSQKREAQ